MTKQITISPYLVIQKLDIFSFFPRRKKIGKFHWFVSGPNESGIGFRQGASVFQVAELEDRLHGHSSLGVPTNQAWARAEISVTHFVARIGPPPLPQPETFPTGIQEK